MIIDEKFNNPRWFRSSWIYYFLRKVEIHSRSIFINLNLKLHNPGVFTLRPFTPIHIVITLAFKVQYVKISAARLFTLDNRRFFYFPI